MNMRHAVPSLAITLVLSTLMTDECAVFTTDLVYRPITNYTLGKYQLHQQTLLNCAHLCLNQPIMVTSVLLHGVTLQYKPRSRTTRYGQMFCCFWTNVVELAPIDNSGDPSLTVIQFCARLETVLFCRAYTKH